MREKFRTVVWGTFFWCESFFHGLTQVTKCQRSFSGTNEIKFAENTPKVPNKFTIQISLYEVYNLKSCTKLTPPPFKSKLIPVYATEICNEIQYCIEIKLSF